MKVELIKSQCINIADFIEMNILDVIRKDVGLDNLGYVEDLLSAKTVLEKAVNEYENG